MKRSILFLIARALFVSCGQHKRTQTVTKEQLTSPLGSPFPSPPFTG